jgi:hypothetical protein
MGTAGLLKKVLRAVSGVHRPGMERRRTAQGIPPDKRLKIPGIPKNSRKIGKNVGWAYFS